MWLEQMVHRIALFLVRKDILDNEDILWGEYLMKKRILSIGISLILLLVGLKIAGLFESMIYTINFMLLRRRAGGYHAKSLLQCMILSVIVQIIVFGLIENIRNSSLLFAVIEFWGVLGSTLIILLLYPRKYESYGMDWEEWTANKKIVRKMILLEMAVYIACCVCFDRNKAVINYKAYFAASIVVTAISIVTSKIKIKERVL